MVCPSNKLYVAQHKRIYGINKIDAFSLCLPGGKSNKNLQVRV
jgi:hypothetical protein